MSLWGWMGSAQGCWGSCWKGSPSHFLPLTWLTRDVPGWRLPSMTPIDKKDQRVNLQACQPDLGDRKGCRNRSSPVGCKSQETEASSVGALRSIQFLPYYQEQFKILFSLKFLRIFQKIKMFLSNHITIKPTQFSYSCQDSHLHWDSFKISLCGQCCQVQLYFINTHLKFLIAPEQ